MLHDLEMNEYLKVYLAGCMGGFFSLIVGVPVDLIKISGYGFLERI